MAPSLKYIPPLPLHLPFYIAVSVAPGGFVVASWSRILCLSPKNWWGQSPVWLGGSIEPKVYIMSQSSKMAFLGILGLLALLSDDQFMMRTSKLLTNG
jgi:hypothetical protein